MKRKKLYFLFCYECRAPATVEFWRSNKTADFVHLCNVHLEEYRLRSEKYVHIYDLRQ